MKGITPVIAVVLLMLISVAIAGFGFVFFARTSEISAESGEQQLREEITQAGAQPRIETISGQTVIVRNIGTTDLKNLGFFVNDKLISHTGPASLASGQVGTYTLNSAEFTAIQNPSTLRVASPGGVDKIKIGTPSQQPPPQQGDTQPPTVSITSPTGGTISGTRIITATAADNIGVVGVQFAVDGIDIGSEDLSAPYSVSWNTATVSDGQRTLTATARDAAGNAATSSPVTVTVSNGVSDTTPPVRSNGAPSGTLPAGTTQTTLSLSTNEAATCKYSTATGTAYSSMTNTFSTTGGTSHSTTVTGLSNGNSYSYYVRCQDVAGNANTNDFAISFSVASGSDTTPPQITGVAASPASSTATITWTTNEPANSQVEYGITADYGKASVTPLDPSLVTSHSVVITGLQSGTLYHFRVKSKDAAGNLAVSTDRTFTTGASFTARIALYAATIEYGTMEANTIIYVNGIEKVNKAAPSVGTFAAAAGDIITSNKPIGLIYDGAGLPVPPVDAAGTGHAFHSLRYKPHTVYIYAPSSDATVNYYFNSYETGSPTQTVSVPQGQIKTMSLPSEGAHRFYSSSPVVMVKLSSNTGDRIFIPPASREVIHTMSEFRYVMAAAEITCYPDSTNCIRMTTPPITSVLSSTQIGDGCGADSDMGLPYSMLGDTYVITHQVRDFAIASVEPNTIRVYHYSGGNFVLYNEYDHSTAVATSPVETNVGSQSGCTSNPTLAMTPPIVVVGEKPFYLRTNDPSEDEYPVIGYKLGIFDTFP